MDATEIGAFERDLSGLITGSISTILSVNMIYVVADQDVSIGNIDAPTCSVSIGPISQNMQVTINSNRISQITQNEYDQKMLNAVDTAFKSNTNIKKSVELSGPNGTLNYTKNVDTIAKSFNFAAFQSLLLDIATAQRVKMGNFYIKCYPDTPINPKCGAQVCIGGITQETIIDIVTTQIVKRMTDELKKIIGNAPNTTQTQSPTTVSSSSNIMFIVFIFIFIIIIIIGISIGVYMYFKTENYSSL